MEDIIYYAPAKINFFLRIGEKGRSNFHKIQSLMRKIGIFDKICFKITNGPYKIRVVSGEVIKKSSINADIESISNENNIVIKAAKGFFAKSNIANKGVDVLIEKNIPFNAGLGGGSSDAAGLLSKLNEAFGNVLNRRKMMELALYIGSDVPFFLTAKDAVVSGFGDNIIEIKEGILPKYFIVLILPDFGINTKEAYMSYDDFLLTNNMNYYNIQYLDFQCSDFKTLEFANDFESVMFEKYPILKEIKESFISYGAEASLLSGSGSTVFGAFKTSDSAGTYVDNLKSFPFHKRVALSSLSATL
ncbi:MAG TPA: 4-(cytidine 5'-diphospho)-2-C-methyl-D-erythritol kinase [bacterium]|nr:4-(cytidine 5'-diphospho)-2-C-methyl-D-erythritol kinase [bacterium]